LRTILKKAGPAVKTAETPITYFYHQVSNSLTTYQIIFKLCNEYSLSRPGCGSGSWKRLIFCGSRSTLKKEAGSGSELGSI